jgi:hypothetical protein
MTMTKREMRECPNCEGTKKLRPIETDRARPSDREYACPLCHGEGRIPRTAAYDALMHVADKTQRKGSRNSDRWYTWEVIMPDSGRDYDNAHVIKGRAFTGSTEKVMVVVRDAAIDDRVPRPFKVRVSREFEVIDEVVQKTRAMDAEPEVEAEGTSESGSTPHPWGHQWAPTTNGNRPKVGSQREGERHATATAHHPRQAGRHHRARQHARQR